MRGSDATTSPLPLWDGDAAGGLPTRLTGRVTLRRAREADLPAIVALLLDDPLGAAREGGDMRPYERAFARIDGDAGELLLVLCDEDDVVGTMQLSLLPGLARRGTLRMQIEAVRVAPSLRARGLGSAMLAWAIQEAGRVGCGLIQLTTDKSRGDAHRFYERHGFAPSHEGFKLTISPEPR